jgi:hypothetical protein
MKATFTEEQQQLAELAEGLAERIAVDGRGGGDADVGWPLLVETGLIGLRLPAEAGGEAPRRSRSPSSPRPWVGTPPRRLSSVPFSPATS